jgi:hypothetical protein
MVAMAAGWHPPSTRAKIHEIIIIFLLKRWLHYATITTMRVILAISVELRQELKMSREICFVPLVGRKHTISDKTNKYINNLVSK